MKLYTIIDWMGRKTGDGHTHRQSIFTGGVDEMYKIIFNTEDSLPISYEILNENFTSIPVSLEKNEYYLDATFRKLYISVE